MSDLVENAPHPDITYRIVGAAMAVHNELGPGHREEVYHRALLVKMPLPPFDLNLEDEPKFPVYDAQGVLVYTYNPDFLVESAVITEIKAQTHPLTNDDVAQVFGEPQVKARGIKVELEHPVAGKLPTVASPMRFSATPVEYKLAPPVLGQHTEEILRGLLQLDDAAIARLRAEGII